jgi:LysM repeat protein
MSFEISIFDLTTGARAAMPMLPADGSFALERGQNFQTFPILGSYPHVQITAPNVRTLTMPLDLWGEEGDQFYRDFLDPAFGGRDGTFRPHLLQIAWGARADQAFTGRPAGGIPPVRHEIGGASGAIFARTLELKLVEIRNAAPRTVNTKTGALVPVAGAATQPYTTREGDDLGSIAKRFGTSIERIAALNGGNPPFVPRAGTPLVVPASGRR